MILRLLFGTMTKKQAGLVKSGERKTSGGRETQAYLLPAACPVLDVILSLELYLLLHADLLFGSEDVNGLGNAARARPREAIRPACLATAECRCVSLEITFLHLHNRNGGRNGGERVL